MSNKIFNNKRILLLLGLFILINITFISGECDPSGCVSDITVTIGDNVIPTLNLISPENNSYYNNNESISLNHTETDLGGIDQVWYSIFNSTGSSEISNTTIIGNVTFNISSGGNYTIYLFANDSDNNLASLSHNFVVDLINPNVSIISPANGYNIPNYVSGSIAIPFNVSINDTNLDSCKYSVSGSQSIGNTSFACSNGYNSFSFSLSTYGSFVINVYSNDSSGRESTDNLTMTISKYVGPSSGGNTNNEEEWEEINYNTTLMCNKVGQFLDTHVNYTYEEKEVLKNELAILLGVAVGDDLLNEYLTSFEIKCPNYIHLEPEEETPEETPEEKSYTWIWWLICGFIILIIFLFFILQSDQTSTR